MTPVHAIARRAGAALFGAAASVLRTRPLHPRGIAFRGEVTVPRDAPGAALVAGSVLAEPGTRAVTARFSRGFGLPEPLPEILSLALKLHGAREQDLLLTAAGRAPVARHLFAGGRSHLARHFTTILPFEAGGRRVVLGAAPRTPARGAGLDELRAAAASDGIVLDLRVAEPLGPWLDVATVRLAGAPLSEPESERLAFTTERDAGGIRAVGVVNAARGGAYDAAQRTRPGPPG